ncbi:MAG: PDZ domain-containing protein [Verrucomicrobia bacterium]|nr:MAG: PDZ domain-containing protein [Verrucomicrobiota bacterium]
MVRILFCIFWVGAIVACQPPKQAAKPAEDSPAEVQVTIPAPLDLRKSVVRINSTLQSWSLSQPWQRNDPDQRYSLGAVVGPQQVLTSAEMVADATYIELESVDAKHFVQAKVLVVDYEVNLALLGPLDSGKANGLFDGMVPLEIAKPLKIGDSLQAVQVEANGELLQTSGNLQSIDLISTFMDDHQFLTYLLKGSMQSAASSFSLPVLTDGKLAGVLATYDSEDQISQVVATEIVAKFLAQAAEGNYQGFPSLGVGAATTEDSTFRAWLKLTDEQGGLYISKVRKGGAADLAGVQSGDVLLAVDGQKIDRRGYFEHPQYGNLFWGHLIRGARMVGESVKLSMLRKGEPIEVSAALTRLAEADKIVPTYQFGIAPNFLVKGGLVFQELTLDVLKSFGENWQTRAPLDFLNALENPEEYEGKVRRVVFLSGSIPTPATVGYESLRQMIVSEVNGVPVKDMKSLIEAFSKQENSMHRIEFQEDRFTIQLDEVLATRVDEQLLQRGIPRLSRAQ